MDELQRILAEGRRQCRGAMRRIDRSLIRLRGHLTLPPGDGVIVVTRCGVAMTGAPCLPAPALCEPFLQPATTNPED